MRGARQREQRRGSSERMRGGHLPRGKKSYKCRSTTSLELAFDVGFPLLARRRRHIDHSPMPSAPACVARRRSSAANCVPRTLRHNKAALPRAGLEKLGPQARVWLRDSNLTHGAPPLFMCQRCRRVIGPYSSEFSTTCEAWVRRQGRQFIRARPCPSDLDGHEGRSSGDNLRLQT